mgnify:CR=1 FL=1
MIIKTRSLEFIISDSFALISNVDITIIRNNTAKCTLGNEKYQIYYAKSM